MSVLVAVPQSAEGRAALAAGVEEAERLGTDLIVMNIGISSFSPDLLPEGATLITRNGRNDRDPAEAVLDEIEQGDVERLVIGLKRRSPVGKMLLGSVSQKLLLNSPVPVLAVKP